MADEGTGPGSSAEELSAEDRAQVLDVLARFAHGIDGRDWPLYRSVFTDSIDIDYASYRAGSAGPMAADAWVERARRLFPGFDATQHVLSNPWLVRAGDGRVSVRTTMRADHLLDGARYTLGGHYQHELERREGSWKIRAVTLAVSWQEGDRALLAAAADRARR